MTGNRIRHGSRRKFTQIDRRVINRPDLSFRAVGVLAWLLDKPDGWTGLSAERLSDGEGREGRDAIRSAMRELETLGYLVRSRVQTSAGLWVTETWVYEHPGEHDAGPSPETENQASVNQPDAVSPGPGKPTVGKPGPNHFSTERDTGNGNSRRATKSQIAAALAVAPVVESPAVELHHPDPDEVERVRAGPIAAARARVGLDPTPKGTPPDGNPV